MRKSALVVGLLLASLAAASVPVPHADVYFSPTGGCRDAVVERIAAAHSQILVAIYTFTDDSIAHTLAYALQRGVAVQVVMDKGQAGGQYSALPYLDSSGIPVRFWAGSGLMHDKYAVIDTSSVVTGSFNWSWSAENKNAENLLIIQSPGLARDYASDFADLWKSSTPIQTGESAKKMTGNYVGNSKTKKFHRPDCQWAKKMSAANQVWFDTREEAIQAGYEPCKVCRP